MLAMLFIWLLLAIIESVQILYQIYLGTWPLCILRYPVEEGTKVDTSGPTSHLSHDLLVQD
jgi:hypothetical protein